MEWAKKPRELIYQNRMQENGIKTSFSRVKMTTCKYKIQGKKIRCSVQPTGENVGI
jgi:hypothetical protein